MATKPPRPPKMKITKIVPECETCGAELWQVASGLLCPNGHGKILPSEEYEDTAIVPHDLKKCPQVKTLSPSVKCNRVGVAMRALERIRKKQELERQKDQAEDE